MIDNGFEDDDIVTEMEAGSSECMLLDFDADDETDINYFPLNGAIYYEYDLLLNGYVKQSNKTKNNDNFPILPKDLVKLITHWIEVVEIEDKNDKIYRILLYIYETGEAPSNKFIRERNIFKNYSLKLSSEYITNDIIKIFY